MSQEVSDIAPSVPTEKRDWIGEALRSPAFIPGLFVFAAICGVFWALVSRLPALWIQNDYYTHGFLIPVIAAYAVYRNWGSLKDVPIKPAYWSLILLIPLCWAGWVGSVANIQSMMSTAMIGSMLVGIAFIAGSRWVAALLFPVLYLGWALPLWTGVIDNYTNPLQQISTSIAYRMLEFLGLRPIRPETDPTTIYLNNFVLDVGIPCSGLKLVLAITAFTLFFMMICGLKWWETKRWGNLLATDRPHSGIRTFLAVLFSPLLFMVNGGLKLRGNILMVLMILPLCLFINSLRIALIGIVGNAYGPKAGAQFHDYSGYITLLLCFVILFKYARLLGWKD